MEIDRYHTSQDLLAAVGITEATYPQLYKAERKRVRLDEYNSEVATVGYVYTGPTLGTPELDAVLLGVGLEYMYALPLYERKHIWKQLARSIHCTSLMWSTFDVWLACNKKPGERLARAIWDAVKGDENV